MFGLTFEKILIIGVIAVFLLGPDRLPHYAAQLGKFVRTARDMATGAKDRMRDEMGPEFDDVDWKKLDPRQYDPRRIIREALIDDTPTTTAAATAAVSAPGSGVRPQPNPDSAYARRQRALAENLGAEGAEGTESSSSDDPGQDTMKPVSQVVGTPFDAEST